MFKKEDIIKFKSGYQSYISYGTNITPCNVYDAFFDSKTDKTDLGVSFCTSRMYEVSAGDFNSGIRYSCNGETYYMFVGANSAYAPAQSISVGKAKDGLVYLVWEYFPHHEYAIQFRIIPEEYIDRNEPGFRPKSYQNSIMVLGGKIKGEITDIDIECLKIASEGILAFSKLIGVVLSKSGDANNPETLIKK